MNRGIQSFVIGALVVAATFVGPSGVGTAAPAAAAVTTTTATTSTASTITLVVNSVLENAVVLLTNTKRVLVGCRPLRVNTDLRYAARVHSRKMAKAGVMSHQLPGELSLGRRITASGYTGWTRVAENIAAGFNSSNRVMSAWWASTSHRRNIADCSLREIGVGVVWSGTRMYWTQDFGRR